MPPLLIKSAICDPETERVVAMLAARLGASVYEIRHDHPATLVADALRLRHTVDRPGVVHAFGMPALAIASLGRRGGIVFSPVRDPSEHQIGWLRAVSAYRRLEVLCSSDTVRRRLVTRGMPADRCHIARPGVKFSSIAKKRDTDLRRQFGFSDTDTVLLVPLEITHNSGHSLAMWATSILHIVQPHYRLLVWGRGPAIGTLAHVRNLILKPGMMTIATDIDPAIEIEPLFSAADGVLMTPSGNVSPMLIAMAMASGRPIVATITQQLCELIEDRHTALLVKNPTQRAIAQRIMDLFADPQLAQQLQDRAGAEAYDYLTAGRFVDVCEKIYAKVEGAHHSADSPILTNPSEA